MQLRCVFIILSYVKVLILFKEYLQIILQEFVSFGFVFEFGYFTGAAVGIFYGLDLGGGGVIFDGGYWNIGWFFVRFVRRIVVEQVIEVEIR